MAATEFGVNHALAVKRWSKSLAKEAAVRQYFRKFMGKGYASMIRVISELAKNAGDKVTFGLQMKVAGDGIEGDNTIEGTSAESALDFYSDYVMIDQRRKGTKSKGKMSEQRVPYNIRALGRQALTVWWAEDYDQQIMMYLAGARGIDTTFHVDSSWTGRATNTLTAPDSGHQLYGGSASAKAGLDSADFMTLEVVEKCISKAETSDPMIQPFNDAGEDKFVLLMHTWDQHNLRISTSTGDWQDLHKNTDGKDSPIYKNALGEYAGVILHKHRNVIRFSDYGDGGAEPASRSLFLGAQAGVIAWGGSENSGKRQRFGWHEETDDRGNALVITAGSIFGTETTIFNSKRFGVIAVDCYCKDPNS